MENGSVSGGMAGAGEGSVEFRVLMAYAQRRWPRNGELQPQPGGEAPPSPPKRKKKKKSNKLRRLLLMCVRAQRDEEEEPRRETVDVTSVADRLSTLVDSVDIRLDDIETDGPDDITQKIVELLREAGDDLNRKIHQDRALAQQLNRRFSYALFAGIATRFLQQVAPSDVAPGARRPPQTRIALLCEVTRRLNGVDGHPMNMVMGFGARYLRENFSTWVQRHGGWENAFGDNEEDEIE